MYMGGAIYLPLPVRAKASRRGWQKPCLQDFLQWGLKSAGGTNELIQDGKTGFLTDDTVKSFADGLEKLMSDAGLRAQMGKEAHQFTLNHRPEKMWDIWEQLLDSLVQRNVSTSRQNIDSSIMQ